MIHFVLDLLNVFIGEMCKSTLGFQILFHRNWVGVDIYSVLLAIFNLDKGKDPGLNRQP